MIVLGNESMCVNANVAVHFSVSGCKILVEEEVFHTYPLFRASSSLGLFLLFITLRILLYSQGLLEDELQFLQ